jgi:glycosyltransferase involved in cell wall biosynthesis
MHVMFIHPNFPAQFGHIANHLATKLGWQCTFVTSIDTTHLKLPFNHINYKIKEGPQPKSFQNPGTFQTLQDHMTAIYRGLRNLPQIKPDLVVGHMSYGTMLYLRNLYKCPFIGYYEMSLAPWWAEGLELRKDYPPTEELRIFNATFHTFTYLHLHACDAGYTPTKYQLSTCPKEMQYKIRPIFDGVDCYKFQRHKIDRPYIFRGCKIEPGTRVITYVSPGLESVRGFDIFMKVAKKIYQEMPNVIFLIAGTPNTQYGFELWHIKANSFKEWVLAQDNYDMSKFHFLNLIPTDELPILFSLSDLHVYLTVPYVLSWSLVQAMSNECTILGSATAPVQEVITDGEHGLLADFYDVDALTEKALRILKAPEEHRHLGAAARKRVLKDYEQGKCIIQLVDYFKEIGGK